MVRQGTIQNSKYQYQLEKLNRGVLFKDELTFRMLAKFAPPFPITLPTALAGINISSVVRGGNLHSSMI